MIATDPVVRIAAAVILVSAFFGPMVVLVHGFWIDPHYNVPDIVSGLLGAAVTAAAGLLGVHLGAVGVQSGIVVAKEANGIMRPPGSPPVNTP